MAIGLLVLLGMLMGTAALVSLTSGDLLSAAQQNSNRDARATAESGADAIIATFNNPQNRKLLVAGKAMDSWAGLKSGGNELRSPCLSINGDRPGGDGQPSVAAVALADGSFRNLVSGSTARQYRLAGIKYASGPSGSSNRRQYTVSTEPGGSFNSSDAATYVANRPNLDDPDGTTGSLRPGHNRGYIALTVEGKVIGPDGKASTSTITREYEVLPKCCGASFGSGGSGGVTAAANNQPSIGADSRLCNLELGIVIGLNGGDLFSFEANDRYTTTNDSGQVVSIPNILGKLNANETIFERSNLRVTPHRLTSSSTSSAYYSPDPVDVTRGGYIQQVIANNYSCSGLSLGGTACYAPINCKDAPLQDRYCFGQVEDIKGLKVSEIPVVPTSLTLPSIPTFKFPWPSGSGARNRVNANNYAGLIPASSGTSFKYIIRTNADPLNPRVETCQTTTNNGCTTGWTTISDNQFSTDPVTVTAGDNFNTQSYGISSGPNNLWQTNWTETDDWLSGATGGRVAIYTHSDGATSLQIGNDGINGNKSAEALKLVRSINLTQGGNNLTDVKLNFKYKTKNTASFRIKISNGTNTFNTDITTPSAAGYTAAPTIDIPSAYVSSATTITITNISPLNDAWFRIDDLTISGTYIPTSTSAWCRYSASSPVTNSPGFHCLGPVVNLSNGGELILDTSGGPLSFYYVEDNDNRGTTFGTGTKLIDFGTNANASMKHVKCAGAVDNCTQPATPTYVPIGYPDQLNFFGRDPSPGFNSKSSYQYIQIGVRGSNTVPGKVAGAWLYFPMGHIEIASIGCGDFASSTAASAFWSGSENWNFSGRIWAKTFRPCGLTHIRVPGTKLSDLENVFGGTSNGSALFSSTTYGFVGWLGTDWTARSISSTSNY